MVATNFDRSVQCYDILFSAWPKSVDNVVMLLKAFKNGALGILVLDQFGDHG